MIKFNYLIYPKNKNNAFEKYLTKAISAQSE